MLRSFIESSGLKEVIAAWILRLFVKSDKIGIVRDDVGDIKFSGKTLLKYRMGCEF